MESKKIKNIMKSFKFKGRLAIIQYWQHNNWGLTLDGQPFRTSEDNRGLEEHRRWCLSNYSNVLVRPDIEVNPEWLAGLVFQRGVAYQRTIRDRDQFWGQLALPVYSYEGTHKKCVGVIELGTFFLKRNYDADFIRIQKLLMEENLETKALIIKVKYMGDTVKFPLLSFGIEYLWESVTERFEGVNQEDFLIKYKDRNSGNYVRIQSDEDLRACITNSSSSVTMFIESFY